MKITVQMDIDIQNPDLGSEAIAKSYIATLLAPLKTHHLVAIRKLMMGPKSSETADLIAVHEIDQGNIETLLENLKVVARDGDQ